MAARLLPVRALKETSSRLSQNMVDLLLPIRKTLFAPLDDKLTILPNKVPMDLIIEMTSKGTNIKFKENSDFLWWVKYTEYINPFNKPIVFFTEIDTTDIDTAHALLLLYFPEENVVDIVSTYALDLYEEEAIQRLLKPLHLPSGPIVRDIACLAKAPVKLRNSKYCYDVQSGDSAEIGWCVAWMVEFTRYLSEKTVAEFWGQPWSTRKQVYKEMYDSFVTIPNYKSLEVGKNVWNSIIEKYNKIRRNIQFSQKSAMRSKSRSRSRSKSRKPSKEKNSTRRNKNHKRR
jgi:hypothetical protein